MRTPASLFTVNDLSLGLSQIKKQNGARLSHKPRPQATCPHPMRPLRPPGRRAQRRLCTAGIKNQVTTPPPPPHSTPNPKHNFLLLAHSSLKSSSHPFASRLRKGMLSPDSVR